MRQMTTVRCCVKQRLFLCHVNDISSSLWFEVGCKGKSAIVFTASVFVHLYQHVQVKVSIWDVRFTAYLYSCDGFNAIWKV